MGGELILIVEDNPKNLKLLRDILQIRGYKTIEAETAEAGVSLAREQRPSLILMDVQLPGMDGTQATKVLKADVETQHIPVIALTSFAMKGDKERLLGEGFDAYMSKPIDIEELPRVMDPFLGL